MERVRQLLWTAADVFPHDEEDAGSDERVLDNEGVEVGRRVRHDGTHDLHAAAAAVYDVLLR